MNLKWYYTSIGAKAHKSLPETYDSIGGAQRLATKDCHEGHAVGLPKCEIVLGEHRGWFLARPWNGYGLPWTRRLYYCWLILTNKASAVQYTEDHVAIARRKSNV